MFKDFINQYPVSKTLRFELKPVGKTEELIRKIQDEQDFESSLAPLILNDEKKAKAYKEAKKYIDDLHRAFLSFALAENRITAEQKETLKETFEKFQENYENLKNLKKQKSKKNDKEEQTQKNKKDEIDTISKELITIQKSLAKELIKILDSNAPKFLETLQEQKNHVEHVKNKATEEKGNLTTEKQKIAETIQKTKDEEQLKSLRQQRDNLDKEIKKKERAIKEYEKILKFKFEKEKDLYKADKDKKKNPFTLLRLYYAKDKEATETIAKFDGFTSYFGGFNKNRENVYKKGEGEKDNGDLIPNSIAYRLFEQNLKFHCDNILKWEEIKKQVSNPKNSKNLETKNWDWQEKLKKIEQVLNFKSEEFFNIDSFTKFFSQDGIDEYNKTLGGLPAEENNPKQRGINELINLTRQQVAGSRKEFPPMQELYKQILSERDRNFIEVYTSNANMLTEIDQWTEEEKKLIEKITKGNKDSQYSTFADLLKEIKNDNAAPIFLSKENLRFFSQNLTGNWNAIENWFLGFDEKTKTQKAKEKVFSLQELEKSLAEKKATESKPEPENFYQQYIATADTKNRPWLQDENNKIDENNVLISFFKAKLKYLIKSIETTKKEYEENKEKLNKEDKLNEQEKKIIKCYLDASLDLFRFLRNLTVKDKDFQKEQEQNVHWKETINNFIGEANVSHIYNKTRNFLTKKDFSTSKFKLNFENATLAGGWAYKTTDYGCRILKKDNLFYLLIHTSIDKDEIVDNSFLSSYEIMDYYQIKGQTLFGSSWQGNFGESYEKSKKQLSNTEIVNNTFCLIKKLEEEFPYAKEIVNNLYESKKDKKYDFSIKQSDIFNKDDEKWKEFKKKEKQTTIIEYLERNHKNLFDYKDDEVCDYLYNKIIKNNLFNGYDRLVDDINKIIDIFYKASFRNVNLEEEDFRLSKRKLYLFEIYSKDFSTDKKKKGTDNLHTIFWKALFEEENLKDVVYKLNGQAELFFRKASIKYSEKKRKEGHHYEDLRNKFNYPILKDKRYSEDKILFHCPITCNFKAQGNNYLNQKVNEFLKDKKDVNIIGIDRGERNLLYYSVINQDGDILEQGSWNIIKNEYEKEGTKFTKEINYQQKLDIKEKERAGARENWETIENIKELKAGYLSQVVHQLSELIVKHNAIVVLEDLNFGFKRGKFKVEKQIYQKFEKALIDKLNYLIFKKETDSNKAGHYLKALQLSNEFKSFQELGKQSGILFYTTAAYTSKTDPITGYMRSLYRKYENVGQAQEFFGKFDSIIFNGEHFEFSYNLKKLKGMTGSYDDKNEFDETKLDKIWTIHSHIERSTYDQKTKTHKLINTNEELKTLFEEQKITLTKDLDIKEIICDPSKTEEYEKDRLLAKIMAHFNRLLDMRVTDSSKAEKQEIKNDAGEVIRTIYTHNAESDFIVSPVEPFYDSRKANDNLPQDSDANGAYNIARKGIIILQNITEDKKEDGKLKIAISKTDWQSFTQQKERVEKQKKKWLTIENKS